MKRAVRAQFSVLAGILGFFIGGLINSGKELVDVMLGAAIGWGLVFFAVYMALENMYKDPEEKSPGVNRAEASAIKKGAEKSKGKKIDITVKSDETFEDIYKLK
jgi:hypothetical protein